jgi:Immunity protein 8
MRGELKSLCSMEVGDLEQYLPDDPECFGFHVMAFIGTADDESSDSFDFVVCSPSWLTRNFVDVRLKRWEYESENLLFGDRLVLMRRWNFQELRVAIAEMSAAQSGADWGTLANRIGR